MASHDIRKVVVKFAEAARKCGKTFATFEAQVRFMELQVQGQAFSMNTKDMIQYIGHHFKSHLPAIPLKRLYLGLFK